MLLVLLACLCAYVGWQQGVAGLLIEPKYQVDLIEGLQLSNHTYRGLTVTEGTHPLTSAILLSGDLRQLQLPSEVLSRATLLLAQSNEFTLMATLRQEERNTGTILAFSEGNNRFLELQSSGRKDELRLHYLHHNTVFVETFPYRLADGSWHRLAVSISGTHVDVFVDCSRIYQRVIHEVDSRFSAARNVSLWLGQRNARHFLFKGSLQDVKIISRAHGYVMQCPHQDTECPTCGQFRHLQSSVFHLENFIQQLTERLAQAEQRLAAVEECECQKSCISNGTAHPDGATWRQGCQICSCIHGDVLCRPVQCTAIPCKNPVQGSGECCPTCLKQCLLHGVIYDHGEQFSPKECIQCECNDGSVQCNRTDPSEMCPELTCSEQERFSVPGECCRFCPDTDYCSQGHDCHVNASCLNLQTRYTCQCNPGYEGDGKHCADTNECLTKGGHNGHHCHVNTVCVNVPGSYICECLPGHKRFDAYTCIENDECSTNDHKCDAHAQCINTKGSYKCQCQEGYTGDGFACHPLCNQTCLNGGHCIAPGQCSCRRGYTGSSCEIDVDECRLGLHQCHANSQCVNMPGWYYCECKSGYQSHLLDNNLGILCQDINECQTNSHTCHSSATCVNEEGSYHCECTKNATCSLDCVYQAMVKSNGVRWHPQGQSCRSCACYNGVVSCESSPCDCNQLDVDFSCCPQCDRSSLCHHQEAPIVFHNGDHWIYQCQTCECLYGEIDCWPMECPPVNCDNPVLEQGSCCPVCQDDPCSSSSIEHNSTNSTSAPHGCPYMGRMYLSGEKVPLRQDPCTSCKCKNGRLCCKFISSCLLNVSSSVGSRRRGRRDADDQPPADRAAVANGHSTTTTDCSTKATAGIEMGVEPSSWVEKNKKVKNPAVWPTTTTSSSQLPATKDGKSTTHRRVG